MGTTPPMSGSSSSYAIDAITDPEQPYMSADDIIAWMQTHVGQVSDQVNGAIQGADKRLAEQQDLNALKDELNKPLPPGGDQLALDEEKGAAVVSFLDEYGDKDPKLCEQLQSLEDAYNQHLSDVKTRDDLAAKVDTDTDSTEKRTDNESWSYADLRVKTWSLSGIDNASEVIKSRIDALGKEDSLGLISIQNGMSQINQAIQLASNIVGSIDQTAQDTIHNIHV